MLHHRKPNRLRGFNYAQDRLYFITSCVQDRVRVFGEIIAHQMILNEFGLIADRQWQWLENQYPYVRVHAHIVMPDHVHAIVEINRDLIPLRTGRDLSVQESNMKIKSLSELIGAYKMTSSKQIHLIQAEGRVGSQPNPTYPYKSFSWQRSFHDRIIRSHEEYVRIAEYIKRNPEMWQGKEKCSGDILMGSK